MILNNSKKVCTQHVWYISKQTISSVLSVTGKLEEHIYIKKPIETFYKRIRRKIINKISSKNYKTHNGKLSIK